MEDAAVSEPSQLSANNTGTGSPIADLMEDAVALPNSTAAAVVFPAPTREELLKDPWAYLQNFFVWVEKRDEKFKTYKCVLCLPKEVRVKAHVSTLSHLRSHVTRKHENHLQDFDAATKQRRRGEKRPGGSLVEAAAKKGQPLIAGWASGAGSGALQTGVNKRIADLFVAQMLSLQVKSIENSVFTQL